MYITKIQIRYSKHKTHVHKTQLVDILNIILNKRFYINIYINIPKHINVDIQNI